MQLDSDLHNDEIESMNTGYDKLLPVSTENSLVQALLRLSARELSHPLSTSAFSPQGFSLGWLPKGLIMVVSEQNLHWIKEEIEWNIGLDIPLF